MIISRGEKQFKLCSIIQRGVANVVETVIAMNNI